uniref:Transmembrane protein 159 n=1 Tax=Piliocolobus tephrosceles TaxID=591936 RepID=A0A8C9GWI3_9PRIM
MAKEELRSISRNLQELQKKLSLLIDSFQNNSKLPQHSRISLDSDDEVSRLGSANSEVVAFMKSPVGQYLDRHPFLAFTLIVFIVMSAVPVGFFLLIVMLTSLAALLGVIILEGLVIAVGGLSLLCILCGLGFVSLVMSGMMIASYVVVSSLINYWFSPRPLTQQNTNGDFLPAMKSADFEGLYQE